jgi:hypothetical protein
MKAETKLCRTFEVLKENFISIESPLTRKTALRSVAWLVDGGIVRAVLTRSTPPASSDEDDWEERDKRPLAASMLVMVMVMLVS